jgi:hypothetical protein
VTRSSRNVNGVTNRVSVSTIQLVHAVMTRPGFNSENDGYARASHISKEFSLSISTVYKALAEGERQGAFVRRPVPGWDQRRPSYEYKAVVGEAAQSH